MVCNGASDNYHPGDNDLSKGEINARNYIGWIGFWS